MRTLNGHQRVGDLARHPNESLDGSVERVVRLGRIQDEHVVFGSIGLREKRGLAKRGGRLSDDIFLSRAENKGLGDSRAKARRRPSSRQREAETDTRSPP